VGPGEGVEVGDGILVNEAVIDASTADDCAVWLLQANSNIVNNKSIDALINFELFMGTHLLTCHFGKRNQVDLTKHHKDPTPTNKG